MRIRSTRPHFWRSERIASVSWDARLVLKGLESYVDDNGVGKDDIALIVGDLFQRDMIREPSRTVARVSEAITEAEEAGLLWRYTIDGNNLLYIAFWEECQRIDKAQAGRFPRPDGTLNYKDSVIREASKNPREHSRGFAPGVVEEGSRGVGEKDDDHARPEPPHDPDAEPRDVVVENPPTFVEVPNHRTRPRPSSAARTVVRQVLGHAGYPDSTIDQLAVQVTKLAREGQPDTLVREALAEWDRRPAGTKPAYLSAILGDLVKTARAVPAANGKPTSKVRAFAELAAEERAREQAQLQAAAREIS